MGGDGELATFGSSVSAVGGVTRSMRDETLVSGMGTVGVVGGEMERETSVSV